MASLGAVLFSPHPVHGVEAFLQTSTHQIRLCSIGFGASVAYARATVP